MAKNTAVFGIYTTESAVERAVDRLKAEGYRNTVALFVFVEIGTLLLAMRMQVGF